MFGYRSLLVYLVISLSITILLGVYVFYCPRLGMASQLRIMQKQRSTDNLEDRY